MTDTKKPKAPDAAPVASGTVTLTDAQFRELLARASAESAQARNTGAIGEEITTRPYREIKAKNGTAICVPPDKGGPIAIDGQHPDDFFAVDADGTATKNAGED